MDEETVPGRKANYRRKTSSGSGDREEGEEEDDAEEGEEKSSVLKREASIVEKREESGKEKEEEEKAQSEEEGEINDGEKVKRAFIPRVLCKYYQRGKCSWGRGCKFLHPGVNDTGNYSFLEFQDPNAKVFQQAAPPQPVQPSTVTDDDSQAQSSSTPLKICTF